MAFRSGNPVFIPAGASVPGVAFWAAENITSTIHYIYTLRGALVRDALEWLRQVNKALYLFGREAEVMFASHSWPRWGNDRIQEVMRVQRDTYSQPPP